MTRLPRFERTATAFELQLTSRDIEILRHVKRHRFLNSWQITRLVGGSKQHLLRRLQRLFHRGYLDRPRAQISYFSRAGSQPIAYALTQAGVRVIQRPTQSLTRYDNRNVTQLHVQHTLLVAEVMVAFELTSRLPRGLRLLTEDKVVAPAQRRNARWTVSVEWQRDKRRVGVVPDGTFALESTVTGERVLYFLEADRSTMPIKRRSLGQSSLFRKLLAYERTWANGIHRHRFGVDRFRVLVVTTNVVRARHVVAACAELPRGRGLFLISDIASLRKANDVLTHPWQSGSGATDFVGKSAQPNAAQRTQNNAGSLMPPSP